MRKIRHRSTDDVIFTYSGLLREADLQGADLQGADLWESNLQGANLQGANLREANLQGAYLRGADLRRSVLQEADLKGANLSGADLRRSELRGADLRNAYLRKAYLQGASLRGADLRRSVLREADLKGANFEGANFMGARLMGAKNIPDYYVNLCKADFINTVNLLRQNGEVPFLRQALLDGRINGNSYHGTCACLVGSIAKFQGRHFSDMCSSASYYQGLHNPAEQWFYQIRIGDTPKTNFFAQQALLWCDEMIASPVQEPA